MGTRRNIFLWVLYDFANSIVSIVFFLYFAQWAVIDSGVSDFVFNLTFTGSAFLLLLTAPLVGVMLDKYWRRISGLRYATAAGAILYGICACFALSGMAGPALIFFTLGLFSYQLSFVFYTPLINDIATPEKRGSISGLGIAANYLGQIAGLVMVLPFSAGTWDFFSAGPRAETLLPAVLVFFILSLPMLLFFQEPKRAQAGISAKSVGKNFLRETKALLAFPSVTWFLLAFFLFNDAILTAMNNFPIFMEQVWGVSDTIKTYLLLAILITSALGGGLAGFVADRLGHKRTLFVVLVGWLVLLPALALLTNFKIMVIVAVFMGFWFGANWAVSRSVMSFVAPLGRHNLAFAYYSLAERVSALLGPVVWGIVVTSLVSIGSDRYRYAVLAITGFILLGLFALARVHDDKKPLQDNLTTIYIARHGEAEWNVKGFIIGQSETSLTDKGQQQARDLARELENVEFDAIFSSDLERTRHTAEIVALPRHLPVNTTELLRERNLARFEGGQWDRLGDLFDILLKHPHTTEEDNQKLAREGIETSLAMIGRFLNFVRQTTAAYPRKTILAVSHGGMMRLLLAHLGYAEKLPPRSMANSGYIRLRTNGTDFFIDEVKGVKKP
ncbi:MAG: hypothetical protein A2751_01940 [Candidatus Doudnabacteria bacterium RIFCSPHIGHO2_01_FULL_46_14]|uniref:Major facilitator superfamily (MFS) profile domain-containing protein n=1 Tax=Candidatus Doudnabacteria bacterium RIFCSPHIGHO2_01_FULL_46_14 TaxID=1817824 RepID=A0A1F5NJH0_9BACT|nr:MAG: hypothetical protein A2751_01940 [Candidatus Doudnabacteria bacterium RIFCSPHIGHO2_01_FULL_46_14]